jgi:small subunit ribosomal protein S9
MTAAPEFRWQAVGRRKTSVARVYLTPGTGKWDINGRTLGDYFPRPSLVQHIQQSFTATDTLGAFDVKAHVDGGGQAGQAGALRLGIARALVEADGQHRTKLRAAGLMTRDPRAVERKKPGRPGARKRFQFSKREEERGNDGKTEGNFRHSNFPTFRRTSHIAGFRRGCPQG